MKEILLTQGQTALVDDEDFERVSQYKWYAISQTGGRGEYKAVGWVNGQKIYMHRFIMQAEKDFLVDHKNHNPLDNRRENLRLSTATQNSQNRRPPIGRYKGVDIKPSGRFQASIKLNGKRLYLGTFDTPEVAARAYDSKAKELFGEFACLNFPESGEENRPLITLDAETEAKLETLENEWMRPF